MNVSRDWHYPDETYQKLGYMVTGNTVERQKSLAAILQAIEQRRGNWRCKHSVDTNYKNHLIKSVASPIPNSDHWTATVSITWSETNQEQLRKFDGPVAGFPSLGEAEAWGVQFAKKWIDDGKAPIRA